MDKVEDKIQIPRYLKPQTFGRMAERNIHHFSDGSEHEYGQ